MIDFNVIITELNAAGYNDSHIARLIDGSQPAIRHLRIKRGAEPRYNLGVAILKLHRKAMREQVRAA